MGNVEVVERVMRAVVEDDLEAILDNYAPEIEIRDAESLPYGGTYVGTEGAVRNAAAYVATWDHLQTDEDRDLEARCFGSGDHVAAVWRQKATGRGSERLDLPAISLFELRDGLVVRLQMFHHDTAAIVRFLAQQEIRGPAGSRARPARRVGE